MKTGACLAFVALAVAACAGTSARMSKDAYEAKLHAAFTTAFARVSTRAVTPKGVATGYTGIATSLRGIRPPANVQSLNDELVAGAAKQAAALNALAARVKGKPRAARDRILAQFDPSGIAGRREFDSAVAGLEAKGYRFRRSAGT